MGVFSLPPRGQVNGKCPSAEVFQVLLPKVATRRQHFLMRYLIQFLVSTGVQLISHTPFALGLQEIASAIPRRLYILPGVFPLRLSQCVR